VAVCPCGRISAQPELVCIFVFSLPKIVGVWNVPDSNLCDQTVSCKGCSCARSRTVTFRKGNPGRVTTVSRQTLRVHPAYPAEVISNVDFQEFGFRWSRRHGFNRQRRTALPGNVDSLRLRLIENVQMIVPVTINHSGPYDFLVDTGAQITTVNPELGNKKECNCSFGAHQEHRAPSEGLLLCRFPV
jgi:hypothetical protein